jgi:hypothetical protein
MHCAEEVIFDTLRTLRRKVEKAGAEGLTSDALDIRIEEMFAFVLAVVNIWCSVRELDEKIELEEKIDQPDEQ